MIVARFYECSTYSKLIYDTVFICCSTVCRTGFIEILKLIPTCPYREFSVPSPPLPPEHVPHCVEMDQSAWYPRGEPGYRDRLTLIMNSMFWRGEDGKMHMTTNAPIFKEVRERSVRSWLHQYHEGPSTHNMHKQQHHKSSRHNRFTHVGTYNTYHNCTTL